MSTGVRTYGNWDVFDGDFDQLGQLRKGRCTYANAPVFHAPRNRWVEGKPPPQPAARADMDVLVSFEGTFRDERPDEGTGVFKDGGLFVGSFGASHLPSGAGTLYYSPGGGVVATPSSNVGSVVGATWSNGRLSSGTESLPNGERYSGRFVDAPTRRCVREGDGATLLYGDDGTSYEGAFKSGRKNGYGKEVDGRTGAVFEGKFVGGERAGGGTMQTLAGHKFRGNFEGGKNKGFGRYTNGITREVVRGFGTGTSGGKGRGKEGGGRGLEVV